MHESVYALVDYVRGCITRLLLLCHDVNKMTFTN